MNSTNHPKKILRADTDKKKGLSKPVQRKLTAACIAVTAIVVILLAAGLSYSVRYTPPEDMLSFEEMEGSMKNQIQKEMKTASSYLERLDGSIAENQKKLDAVNAQLTERQESLMEVETTQKKLTENASDVTVKVKELEKKTETQINTIRQDMENVHTDIKTTLDKVSEIIASMEKQNVKETADHTETLTEITRVNESVLDVNKAVHSVEDKLSETYENLKSLLKEMQTGEESLLKEIQSGEEEKQLVLIRQLEEIESSLKVLLDADMTQITEAFSTLTSEFQDRLAQLEALLDGRMNRLDQNMNGLDSNMNQLGQNMNGLDSDMDQLGQDIMGGLDSNRDSMDSGIGNLNGSLHEMGTDLSGNIGNLGSELNSSIGSLGSNLSGSIGSLDGKMDDFHTVLNKSLLQLQQDFAKQLGDINVSSVQNMDALRAYMGELNSALRQDLNQVFTSASNGKKGLASALLTKGITVKEDATFTEIKDAILNIPQQLVIGVQEIPGTITYHYHYHLDPDGNRAGETAANDRQGGCYTTAVYHTHDDSCYHWSHEHNDHCKSHPIWVDWDGEGYWGKIYDCGDSPANVRGSLICTLPTSESGPIYYELGCGLLDGQIIGAEIAYDSNAVKSRNAVPDKKVLKAVIRQSGEAVQEVGNGKIPPVSEELAAELDRLREEEKKRQEEQDKQVPAEETKDSGEEAAAEEKSEPPEREETGMQETDREETETAASDGTNADFRETEPEETADPNGESEQTAVPGEEEPERTAEPGEEDPEQTADPNGVSEQTTEPAAEPAGGVPEETADAAA